MHAPEAPPASTPGRGLVIAGAILLTISIIGGLVGTALTVGRFESSGLNDVAIDGARYPQVPGRLAFRVLEPLGSDGDVEDVRVGIAVDYEALPLPVCTMEQEDGEEITLRSPAAEEQLLSDDSGDLRVLGTAMLPPGRYVATCGAEGDTAGAGDVFTVGRVFGFSDLGGVLAPILWFFVVGAIATVTFVLGGILLIVGLVRRSRARKQSPMPTAYPPAGGQPGYPGYPGYPPQGYPPQAGYPRPPSSLPWPGPHAPGPPGGPPPAPPTPPPAPPPAPPAPPTAPPGGPGSDPAPSGWTVPPTKKQ
ncbi:MAG: hypothetical protein ACYC2O_02365 [Microthrixaceae bacterium]